MTEKQAWNMDSQFAAGSGRDASKLPWKILVLVFVVLSARWIWVARSGTDFGWTYEPAWRIAHGGTPYRDFVQTLPVLAPYIIAGLMKLMGDSFWAFQINLYVTWLGAMAVGLALIGSLETSVSLKVVSVLTASSMSFPFILGGHAHSYQGPLFAGLVAYFFLRYLKSWAAWDIFAAGLFTGLALFAKQNVGLFIGLTAGLSLLLSFALAPHAVKKCACSLLFFVAGVVAVCVPFMALLSYRVGLREVFMEMFVDASAGKGHALAILERGLPRFILNPSIPHRRFVELLVSGGLLAACCIFLLIMLARRNGKATQAEEGNAGNLTSPGKEGPLFRKTVAAYFGVVVILWTATLFDLPRVRGALEMLHPRFFFANNWVETAGEMAYLGTMSAALVCLWLIVRRKATRELLFPCGFLIGIAFGSVTSNLAYFVFAAPVAIPLLIHILARLRFPGLHKCATWAAVVFLTVATLFPAPAETAFCQLLPLPKQSPFAGLYADPAYQQWVDALWNNVTPMIRGHRTLWLIHGDPHSAYGGLPVLNAIVLDSESYSSRSEERLWKAWQQDTPEFVVLGPFVRAANAKLLQQDELNRWLASQYTLVWTDPQNLLTLWKLKQSETTVPRQAITAPTAVLSRFDDVAASLPRQMAA